MIQTPSSSSTGIHSGFTDGSVYKELGNSHEAILLRVYLDEFGTNSVIGSSHDSHKILGVYYSPFNDPKVCSKRATVTMALINHQDVATFGLEQCLERPIQELEDLTERGIYDPVSKKVLDVVVMVVQGDNLQQHQVMGMVQNFSRVEHGCRHCLASRTALNTAATYEEIHCEDHKARTLLAIEENRAEAHEKGVIHVNSVTSENVFYNVPSILHTEQFAPCFSHDIYEGAMNVWLLIVTEGLVSEGWLTWEKIESVSKKFPFKGRDNGSKPPVIRPKKMKIAGTQNLVGNFSEISTLIHLFTAMFFDYVKDENCIYWQFILKIRKFVKYIHMIEISDQQLQEMNASLNDMMNCRMDITRKGVAMSTEEDSVAMPWEKMQPTPKAFSDPEDCDMSESESNTSYSSAPGESTEIKVTEHELGIKAKRPQSLYHPPIRWKEHYLSHYKETVEKLAPLPLLATDLFESCHSFLKWMRIEARSSRNLLYTISKKDGLLSAYHAAGSAVPPDTKVTGLKQVTDSKILSKHCHSTQSLFECRSMTVFGTSYKKNSYVILPNKSSPWQQDLAVGKIVKLLVTDSEEPLLYTHHCESHYDQYFDLFVIKPIDFYELIAVKHLRDFLPLESYRCGRVETLSLRRHILQS